MGPAAKSLETMNVEQMLLAMVLLGSYAFALGELGGLRARFAAGAIAVGAAAGFAAFSASWESAFVLVAFVVVGMGAFAAVAWTVWAMATWRPHTRHRLDTARRVGNRAPPGLASPARAI